MRSTDPLKILIIGGGTIGAELYNHLYADLVGIEDETASDLPELYNHLYVDSSIKTRLCRHTDYKEDIEHVKPDLIVNAAGIAGQKKCEDAGKDLVWKANIEMAIDVANIAESIGSRCLLFSTCGVYNLPHSTPKREDANRYAPNLYVESKIEMEDAVADRDVIVFRIPTFIGGGYYPNDIQNRIRTWQWCQDAYAHLLYGETLASAVRYITQHSVRGVFNIADHEFVYLPSFVKRHYKELPIREDTQIPASFTQTHLLDTTKARTAGILK